MTDEQREIYRLQAEIEKKKDEHEKMYYGMSALALIFLLVGWVYHNTDVAIEIIGWFVICGSVLFFLDRGWKKMFKKNKK